MGGFYGAERRRQDQEDWNSRLSIAGKVHRMASLPGKHPVNGKFIGIEEKRQRGSNSILVMSVP